MSKFKSSAQRKAVFAKLKDKGFKQKPIKITQEGDFIRARIIHPSKFQKGTFRNIPAGRDNKEGTRLIIARPKKGNSKTTRIQAILIPKT